jgi:O-acetyl-ADP-ribose deacetylase (regulator of RNase III)
MLYYVTGDLLLSPATALVNPVNVVGVMGKGLALQFKLAFPDNFKWYKEACDKGEVKIGRMYITSDGKRFIINFPTKKHWRDPSKLEWVEEGLQDLLKWIYQFDIDSIALPALGCGNGGLNWDDSKALIEKYLLNVKTEVFVYIPIK